MNFCKMRIWERGSSQLIKLFVGFVRIISDRTVPSLESSALLVYPVHTVLLISIKKYKKWLIQKRHCPIIFIVVEYVQCEYMRHAEISESRESVYRTSTSQVLDCRNMISVSSDSDRERGR